MGGRVVFCGGWWSWIFADSLVWCIVVSGFVLGLLVDVVVVFVVVVVSVVV